MSAGPPERSPVTLEGLRRAGVAAWAILAILLLAATGIFLLYQVRVVFPPLVLALLLIYLLNPLVTWLERRGLRRWIGTLAIYFLFVVVVFVGMSLLVPAFQRQFHEFGNRLPELRANGTRSLESLASKFGPTVQKEVGSIADRVQTETLNIAGQLARFGLSALHLVLIFVLAPVIALYLLVDLPRLSASFIAYLPPRYRKEWLEVLRKSGATIGGFFRGQLIVALIVGVLSSIFLALVRVPFALPIGMLVGFFNIIPLVGPILGGAIAVLVAAVDGGLIKAVLAGAAMVAVQQTDNHFISPKILGKALKLHPVIVILALLAGGTLAGLWGMLIAVPGVGVAKVFFEHYYTTRVLGELGTVADTDVTHGEDGGGAVESKTKRKGGRAKKVKSV